MLEMILNCTPAAAAAVLFIGGLHVDHKRRRQHAQRVHEKRREAYAEELERIGARIRRQMAASAPLAGEIRTDEEDASDARTVPSSSPKLKVDIIATPKSCVVRRLQPGRREACLRELYCKL